ncbi:SsrA-binding protein SmpB [Helcobacillus massiliensis]|uniref:SsrA-binding protein SmpB n=1 Tax=Helcobacillus TaxID=1161125 RepID=UPI001EF51588|nr:SsrA-binding protein SmpB [Helcobacillus massiliensis]MCG7426907.1 SsrA-binding protein SmpB [Helcobacillus sp. ACRRO]MCT1557431.1 SsrA-binding protein SmpB [Helcobacillus massiliensis]MCT2036388.1 SsrA-binding protein SmpB [Helcobacillus massiliensis]MCT2331870.1 SsrA-binding protein SmpB [Helcobacillus massiliensis]MDK7742281.1 SsrA-binding protein SmpB [Helcobacillus massiliensis]
MSTKASKSGKRPGGDAPERKKVLISSNKRALHDYHIDATWEAGIVLTGTEVKSLRDRGASLVDGFCYIDGGEMWMEHVHIAPYVKGTWTNHAARRKRKLLMHKSEILKLMGKTREKGRTIVPLELYFLGSHAKVKVALARGKKEWDKRQTLREKQDNREAQRAMRHREKLGG